MTNTLTPEQREEIQNHLDHTLYKFVTKEELYDDISEGKRLLHLLLASEQAWKEEAEKLKKICEDQIDEMSSVSKQHTDMVIKLNQAIEMLRELRNFGVRFQIPFIIDKTNSILLNEASLSQEGEQHG